MKPLCIYHGNCADGFGAAWVIRKALGSEVDFHAGVYQNNPPALHGRDVILVDFSYKRAVMEVMADEAASILILDHHKSAAEDLAGFSAKHYEAHFDMEHSGAMLAWFHCFPGQEPPQLLKHIEDRDLWRFHLPFTREIQANVFSYPYDFGAWDELMAKDPELLAKEGGAIERKHFKDIHELIEVVTRRMVIAGHNVPVANLPYTLTSDAGHKLATGEAFAGCYWDTPAGRVFSLRSTDDGLDVSEIAKQYGGGGHRNASGFRVPYDRCAQFEIATGSSQDTPSR